MKKITPFLLAAFLFTACGGGSSSNTDCFKEYWDGTVGVCLPKAWIVIDQGTLQQRGVPEDTVVAFQSQEPVSGQFITVSVTKETLSDVVLAEDFSAANIRSVSVLPGYELIDNTKVNIDGAAVDLHIFTAQPIADEPKRRFYQVSTVHETTGYTVTATSPTAVESDVETQIISILQSTTFVNADAEAEKSKK